MDPLSLNIARQRAKRDALALVATEAEGRSEDVDGLSQRIAELRYSTPLIVEHGTDEFYERPSADEVYRVEWVGSVRPLNARVGIDLWTNPPAVGAVVEAFDFMAVTNSLYYSAADTDNMTLSSGRVHSWSDINAGNAATYDGTTTHAPELQTDADGYPCLDFGANDFLTATTGLIDGRVWTVLVVGRTRDTVAAQKFVEAGYTSGASTGSLTMFSVRTVSGRFAASARGAGATNYTSPSDGTDARFSVDTDRHIMSLTWTQAESVTFQLDDDVAPTNAGPADATPTTLTRLRFGATAGQTIPASDFLDGQINAVLILPTTDAAVVARHRYMLGKEWGLESEPSVKKISQDSANYESWPFLWRDATNGRLFASWSSGPKHSGPALGRVQRISYSDDDGLTWTAPVVIGPQDAAKDYHSQGGGYVPGVGSLIWIFEDPGSGPRPQQLWRIPPGGSPAGAVLVTTLSSSASQINPHVLVADYAGPGEDRIVCPWMDETDFGVMSADPADLTTWVEESIRSTTDEGITLADIYREDRIIAAGLGRVLGIGRVPSTVEPKPLGQFQRDAAGPWTVTETNISDAYRCPVGLVPVGDGRVVLLYGDRGAAVLRVRVADIDDVYADPTSWPASQVVTGISTGSDSGYPQGVMSLDGTEVLYVFYNGVTTDTDVFFGRWPLA